MMTTGGSRDDVRGPTALIIRKRVETFSIGVGRRYSLRELQYIATDPRHVYTAAFRNLGSIVKLLKRKICKSGMHNALVIIILVALVIFQRIVSLQFQ